MDRQEFIGLWAEKLQCPEGRDACLYSLGMTVGNLVVQLEDPGVDPVTALESYRFLQVLRDMAIEARMDISLLDDLWDQLRAAIKVEGPSVWDHILDET